MTRTHAPGMTQQQRTAYLPMPCACDFFQRIPWPPGEGQARKLKPARLNHSEPPGHFRQALTRKRVMRCDERLRSGKARFQEQTGSLFQSASDLVAVCAVKLKRLVVITVLDNVKAGIITQIADQLSVVANRQHR